MKDNFNFDWRFIKGFEPAYLHGFPEDSEKVDIPHSVETHPYDYFSELDYQGVFTYFKKFDLEDDLPIHILHFEGYMLQAHIYINEIDLGNHISGYLPVKIDISKHLKKKGNLLVVVLSSVEDKDIPPFGHVVDYLTFGGIYRPLHLEGHRENYIENLFAFGKMDGSLHVENEVNGEGKVTYKLFDHYKLVKEFEGNDIKIDNPILWELDNPHLYTLKAYLGEECSEVRFGFRNAIFKEDGFYLNGKKIKLRGLNRHQNYPYVGPALPSFAQFDDARIIKEDLGCNIVRTSHYPDSEAFLDACDELGLLLIDEVPGWQHVSKEKAWRNNFHDFIKRMVIKERKHPCLIAYGLRIDESPDDHELYAKANEIQKEFDPFRQSLGVRNFLDSECLEDVYCYNDFVCSSLKEGLISLNKWKGAKGKPKLVSEYMGHMYPTKAFDPMDRRLEHALRHAKVVNDSYGLDGLSGAIGWCAFDYNTHQDFGSNDHICYHGVADIFRNPKLAAGVYSSFRKKPFMEISSQMAVGDSDECLQKPAWVFTNADYVALYHNDVFVNNFYPDKKDFPNLKHPPIKVDDFIGERWEEKGFSKKDGQKIIKALNTAAQIGFQRLSAKQALPMVWQAVKHHLSFNDLAAYYYKYISNWGQKASIWKFVAYKKDKPILSKEIGPSNKFHYEMTSSTSHLNDEITYQVARIQIVKVDEFGTRMPYANDPIELSADGPIEIIGPKIVSLHGGAISVYIRNLPTNKECIASLHAKGQFGEASIQIVVS